MCLAVSIAVALPVDLFLQRAFEVRALWVAAVASASDHVLARLLTK